MCTRTRILFLPIVLFGCTIFCAGQKSNADFNIPGVRKFTTHFYAWYIKAADTDRIAVLRTKEMQQALAPELLQALKRDYEAQAQDKTGYIVGLDFDPFLATQDPCEQYEVRKIVKKQDAYWAEIHGIGGCEAHSNPDLSAEVKSRNGVWVFTNFYYHGPFAQDLLTLLRKLHRDRMK
jgi:hypothetical protein